MILGVDIYSQIIKQGIIKGQPNTPIAQYTLFGWIISGSTNSTENISKSHICHVSFNENINYLMQKFWELEEVPTSKKSLLSVEEQECETHFQTTHSRDVHGRYIVKLPFKISLDHLGNSKFKAEQFMTKLINRFKTDTEYAQMYTKFLAEYEELKHMSLIPPSQPEPDISFYLPHHGVWRESSATTKLRVVFNGSSKTNSGFSLNDLLHTGHKLQTELFDVLLWFRQFRYVFTSDVEKMYRQIKVHPEHWDYQRILWMDKFNNIQSYHLTTVTYGQACAPFLALRSMLQLVQDDGPKFPAAISTLTKGRYVDDVFGGADTVEEAQIIVQQVNQLCMAGGFRLHKWATNSSQVLNPIPETQQLQPSKITIKDDFVVHSLGLSWKPSTDLFLFSPQISVPETITKRSVLSTIAKLFDPLGLLAPVLITAKIFMQELWTMKLEWDDSIPINISHKWRLFMQNIQDLHILSFPRWLGCTLDQNLEIHGFADASNQAFAAVVYARSITCSGHIHTQLICSKTKVAPLKRLTIPRLELTGATLLVKLVTHILKTLDRQSIPIYLWTDSSVAYTWILNHPSRWKDFVHNRVVYIQESLPHAKWSLVPGHENPADLATRGMSPKQLSDKPIWWEGPSWLSQPANEWPQQSSSITSTELLEEQKNTVVLVNIISNKHWDLLQRYSNIHRLLRITAICQRAISRFRKKPSTSLVYPLNTVDLQKAKYFWVKKMQNFYFQKELKIISDGKFLPPSHSFKRLVPYIDSNGLLRVGERLQLSLLPADAKHPIILPKDSPFTSLIIAEAHERSLHGGTQLTLSFIREEFWILGGRIPVRKHIFQCVRCFRFRQKRAQQLMGQLPKERLTPSRPFLNSGVDYAGPVTLKTWRGRNAKTYKAYIALFVCMTTSSVHIELVTDYTADSFIAAYKRFTSRRGICSILMSDCGTNFKGADVQLQRLFSEATIESQRLALLLAKDGTQWKFPPSAPHFGGKWEAGVKSVKYHLHRVIGESLLTYEELSTLLIQIEAVLNSRPLIPLTNDPEDFTALTPGHFLMGCSPTILPEPCLESKRISYSSRWKLLRQMLDSFWARWSRECLQRYHSIYKWQNSTQNIKEGTMVIVLDERYPPAKWPIGRVIKTHPGPDGQVRVVTVRTQTSILKRPITKLCPLPINNETL